MDHAPAPRPPDTVRVVVEDVPELEDRVREAARRAQESHQAVELVEAFVDVSDHAARALMSRRMDEALEVARHAAPGVEIRVGVPVALPGPRRTS